MKKPAVNPLPYDVEIRDIPGHKIAQHLNVGQLADALGTSSHTLMKYVTAGVIRPDFRNKAANFFAEARLEEIKTLWRNRSKASLDSAPVKGVITPFGMMIPRARPDAALLERLIRTRPRRPSRDSSWRTRSRYNLKDLTP